MAIKKNKISRYTLIAILLLGFLLRFYKFGSYPPLNADEAAIGYNAYSLLKTGKDEHGDFFPLHFKSFGDYKPGGYFYVVLPFVAVLGLNEWAVRIPSALAGVATIWLVYKLSKLLWKKKKLALVWALVLSISPWHIHFSRGGWESNFALFLTVLGVYLLFKSKFKQRKQLIFSALSFVFALYTYHSSRLVVPALVLSISVFNFKKIWKNRQKIFTPLIIGVLVLIPLAVSFLKGGASSRFSGVGLFADKGPIWRVNELLNQHNGKGFPFVRIIHNKFVIYGISFAQKYFSHFNFQFLFIDGDSVPRSKLPDMGVLHLVEAGLLLVGLFMWFREKRKDKYLPILFLLVSPLASALTFQAPSALRSLPLVIPLTFFISYGIIRLYGTIFRKFFLVLIVLGYLWCFSYWQNNYFVHYLKRFPSAWPDYEEIVPLLKEVEGTGEKVCVQGNYDQPYILTLFYLKYPPEKIQSEIQLTPSDEYGFSTVERFGNYQFGNCDSFDGKILGKET